jgi:hypothetical protein
MVDHGLTTGAIMLEGLGDGFNPHYSVRTLEKIRDLAFARDIEIVLTVWPEPTEKYLKDFERKIEDLLGAAGAAALEFDLESNWTRSKVQGFANLDKAGDELVAVFHRIAAHIDVRTEVTTFPEHPENSRTADVAPHANRLLPQAYSVQNRTSGDVAWDSKYGPGRMQTLTLDKALTVPGVGTTVGPLISCGLAAYEQVWAGRKGEEAMIIAYNTALSYRPMELRWWSSKWVLGIKENGYASRFLKGIK